MPLQIQDQGDVTVARFVGYRLLGDSDIQGLVDLLDEDRNRRKILLDFGNIEYMNSSVLGMMIKCYKKLTPRGGRIAFCNVIPGIFEVFTITKLDKIFPVEKVLPIWEEPPDEDEEGLAGVKCRLIPPKPSGKGSIALPPPSIDKD